MRQFLCRLDELEDPGSAGFTIDQGGRPVAILVVRRGDKVFGYVNNCPHAWAPLDWQDGQFLDLTRHHIQCSLHGATFRIDDGRCVGGPCAGKGLTPVAVATQEGVVFVGGSPQ